MMDELFLDFQFQGHQSGMEPSAVTGKWKVTVNDFSF